ncbi:hypothetical protein QBC46DRAFT_459640 [Diplogelasinospora grovesii]|uniref:chitinase n=1 Tax=Diplogelasinospora grovesii TaxID=303347 RepID=A0AAN6N789_9PEZI|nr:hypothetical protein QBC46DRAFT_459640 [Diplogelasinospora grovesii]
MRPLRLAGLRAAAAVASVEAVDVDLDEPLYPCPVACADLPASNWTPLLFDFALYNPLHSTINALKRDAAQETSSTLELLQSGADLGESKDSAVSTALQKLSSHFHDGNDGNAPCAETVMFGYHQGVVAGIYLGPSFGKATVSSVMDRLLEQVHSGSATTVTAQLCGEGRNAHHVFGMVVNTAGNITAVQNIVKDWNEAKCLTDFDTKSELNDITVWENPRGLGPFPSITSNGTIASNFTRRASERAAQRSAALRTRQSDTCTTEKVVSGDSYGALASRCGISGADFTRYNPDPNFCSTLQPGQLVCCSSGSLPDVRPKPNEDGSCASHLVVSGDTCSALAGSNGLKLEDIEKFNNGTTWGWYGCNKLLTDMYICLSEGKPPMPYPIQNAVCGPTKPGSTPPTGTQELKDLNPCPLNACCNLWGQCGISGDFCTEKASASGNPGTSGLQNGCVSNCGMEIKNKDAAPASYGRVGYYETWNFNRPCLNMRVDSANTDGSYTVIHWAFAEVNTADWSVKITDDFNQWDKFKKIQAKKVISFGGWGYSTEPETYDVLRQAMTLAHRDAFVSSIASFLSNEGLDGVDFDWEYPGAIDIPGTPPGQATDGPNYLKFLSTMKSKLPSGKTMSIAAPASFWYLKAFPINNMAKLLDYIVYMTYDLHGQWDAGNQYSIDGCPAGNCLRSHVNLTETTTVLAMITKASVPTNKIFVGESSYGRSFKMAEAGCTGPTCTFLGDRLNSPAAKGRCTDTSGYISNAEIDEIINSSDPDPEVGTYLVETFHDGASNSDILVYEGTEWVAYMSKTTKQTRREHWKGFNFAGTIDWAVDLQAFTLDDYRDPKTGEFPEDLQDLPPALGDCKGSYATLEAINAATDISDYCASVYTVEVLANTLKASMSEYDALIADGYDKKFHTRKSVRKFMYDHGNDYFHCDVSEAHECCDWCHHTFVDESHCRYCDNKYCAGWSTICDNPEVLCDGPEVGWFNVSGPCPPDYSLRAGPEPTDGYGQTVYWHLDGDREADFWADLYTGVGIDKDNIRFEDVENYHYCTPATPEDCKYFGWDFGIPVPHGYDEEDVINPKDVVSDAYANLKNIVADLPRAVGELKAQTFEGPSAGDLADAIALPVFMIEDAVSNIKTISDTIDEMEEERRKNIILAFLSAIFFFVPVIGEIASAVASLATIGRIISILGAAGQLAADIYSVVDTEGNDPLAIFSVVLAPLAIFDAVQIAKAATRARGMSAEDIGKLGKNVHAKMDLVRKTSSVCKAMAKRNVFPVGALPMSGLNADPVWSRDFN